MLLSRTNGKVYGGQDFVGARVALNLLTYNKYFEHNKNLFLLNLTTTRVVKTNLVKIGKKTKKIFFRFLN